MWWRCSVADPKAPSRDYQLGQLCEDLGVLPIDLGTLLQRYGFAIVSEADRKVLRAMKDDPDQFCDDARWWCDELQRSTVP